MICDQTFAGIAYNLFYHRSPIHLIRIILVWLELIIVFLAKVRRKEIYCWKTQSVFTLCSRWSNKHIFSLWMLLWFMCVPRKIGLKVLLRYLMYENIVFIHVTKQGSNTLNRKQHTMHQTEKYLSNLLLVWLGFWKFMTRSNGNIS